MTRDTARLRVLGAYLVLAGLVVLTYHHTHLNGFHFDDLPNIVDYVPVHMTSFSREALWNAATHPSSGSPHRAGVRYLPTVTFAIDWWRGGGSPVPFQQTNLAIHIAVSLGVLTLLRRLVDRERNSGAALAACFVATAAWALHPIQLQAVTYIVQRMTSMATFFVVGGVYFYVRARRSGRTLWFGPMMICLGLGAIGKENAWITPLLLLLAEYAVVRSTGRLVRGRTDVMALSLPVLAGLAVVVDLVLGLGLTSAATKDYAHLDFTMTERLLTQPRVITFHLSQVLLPLPDRFSITHDFPTSHSLIDPPQTLVAMAGLFVWVGAGLYGLTRPRMRLVAFFALWVPVTLAVESSFAALHMVFEHRMYLATIGLAGLAALGLDALLGSGSPPLRHATTAAAALVLLGLIASTRARVPVWRDDLSLWTYSVQHSPDSVFANANLGKVLWGLGRHEEAVARYEKVLELNPNQREGLLNLGRSYSSMGRKEESILLHQRAIQLNPGDAEAHYSLGITYMDHGDLPQARKSLFRTLTLDPGHPQASMMLRWVEQQLSASQSRTVGRKRPGNVVEPVPQLPGGLTVAGVYADLDALNGTEVALRGQVVKASLDILGRNWLHIKDGTGAAGADDLTVTTTGVAQVGDVVVVRGTLVRDRDFGAGYHYDALLEDASVSVE